MAKFNANSASFEPEDKRVKIVMGDKKYYALENLKGITTTINQPLSLEETQVESTISGIQVIPRQIEKPPARNLPQTNIVITDIVATVIGDLTNFEVTFDENFIAGGLDFVTNPYCLVVKGLVGMSMQNLCIDLSQATYLSVSAYGISSEFNTADFTLPLSGTFVSCEEAFLTSGMQMWNYGAQTPNYIGIVRHSKSTYWNEKVKVYNHSQYGYCVLFHYIDNPDDFEWYKHDTIFVDFDSYGLDAKKIRFSALNGLTIYSGTSITTNKTFVRTETINRFIHELPNIFISGDWSAPSIAYDKEKFAIVPFSSANLPVYIPKEEGNIYYEDFVTALNASVEGDKIYVTADTDFNYLSQTDGYAINKEITIILSDGITFGGALVTNKRFTLLGENAKLVDFSIKLNDATFDIKAKSWYNPAWKGSGSNRTCLYGTNTNDTRNCYYNVDEVLSDRSNTDAGAIIWYENKASVNYINFKSIQRINGITTISLAGQCAIKGEFLKIKGYGHALALQNMLDGATGAFHSRIQITEVVTHVDSGVANAVYSESISIENIGNHTNLDAHYHIVDTNVKIITSDDYDPAKPFAAIKIIKDNLHLHNVKVDSSIEEAAVIVGGTYVTAEIDNCEIRNTNGKALLATQFLGQTTVKNSILEGNSTNAVVDIGILNNITNIKIQNSEIRNKHASGEIFYVGNCVGSNISGNDFVLDGNLLVGKNELFNRDALLVITGATKAASCVLSIADADDWCRQGSKLLIKDVVGMTELNGNTYTVTAVSSTTVTINVNSSGFTDYVSGGTAQTVVEIKIRRDNLTNASNTASDYIILKENSSGIIVDSDIT